MIRLIAYLLLAAIVAVAVHFAATQPGFVTVEWFGYRLSTHTSVVAIALFVFTLFFLLWGWLWAWLRAAPKRQKAYFDNKQQHAAYRYALQGLEALAAGDVSAARHLAQKGAKIAPDNTLLALLKTEVGTTEEQEQYFNSLLAQKNTRFIGAKGLFLSSCRNHNTTAAANYLKIMEKEKPKAPWVLQAKANFMLQCKKYEEVLKTLSQLQKFDDKQIDIHPYMKVFINTIAGQMYAETDYKIALQHFKQALLEQPCMLPAIEGVVNVYKKQGEHKKLRNFLRSAFRQCPRIDIFALWLTTLDGGLTAEKQRQQAEKLCVDLSSQGSVPLLCLALVHQNHGQWTQARTLLLQAKEIEANRYVYQQLALCEDKLSPHTGAGYEWLKLAVDAPAFMQPGDDVRQLFNQWCIEQKLFIGTSVLLTA